MPAYRLDIYSLDSFCNSGAIYSLLKAAESAFQEHANLR
jgi:hypothetical protein